MGKFCGTSHPDNQGFGCIGCKNFWSTSVNVVVYLGSSYFTIFLLCVEVEVEIISTSDNVPHFSNVLLCQFMKIMKMIKDVT